MPKIGVYIPDDRMVDIEEWREKINFSQLFMEAFDRTILAQAQLPKLKEKEMKTVVERLQRAAASSHEHGWKAGVHTGRVWAIKYSNLSHLREIGRGELAFAGERDDVKGFLRTYYESVYRPSEEEERDDFDTERFHDGGLYRQGFNRGFVESAKSVWDGIKVAFEA
jgi:hypothetical protein